MTNASKKMDNQYRLQRHFYDISRKYYLFGRDRVLNEILLEPQQSLLEIGCGTGRNLRILSKQFPESALYGVDASEMMLDTAKRQLNRSTESYTNIRLEQGLAQQITHQRLGSEKPFDHVLFSYVLSMIPDWRTPLEHAINNLSANGQLHIVDFSDMATMPRWFKQLVLQWLNWFHVHPDNELLPWLQQLKARKGGELTIKHTAGRYAQIAHYRKADDHSN